MGNTKYQSESTLGFQNFPHRNLKFKNVDIWLDDKRAIDGAEGLWRIHDNLYDLTDFIDTHPGGKFWLESTKGTDITEAFESHHISTTPEELVKKFYVRKAKSPRSSPFTFEENGFYKTLKRHVREALKTVPKDAHKPTKHLTDATLVGAFACAILACTFWSYTFATFSGLLFACTVIASHNYAHQRDQFRMYYGDIAMLPSRETRVLHILSHHLFTNTVVDMQAYNPEPIMNFYPHSKSKWVRYGSWIYVPLLMWPTLFLFIYSVKLYQRIFLGGKSLNKADALPLTIPVTMYLLGGQSFLATMWMWLVIVLIDGFTFGFIGTTTTHFHPDIFMDGDKPRNGMDWGINQLDTVADRYEVTGNLFLVLVSFGDHALHHLFPTFDQGVLQYLYPIVEKTMKEFNVSIRMTTHMDMVGGFFRQLAREKPNPNPPNLLLGKGVKYN